MLKSFKPYFLLGGLLISGILQAQEPQLGNRLRQLGSNLNGGGGSNDSLQHRDKSEDSITISFRYLDSTRSYRLDSSVNDFTKRFPLPGTFINLGNTGTAARSLLFSPRLTAGFDPGFHAFDIYKWKLSDVRFFNTTRPYTELNYLLGSRVEQMISLVHSQNIKPNWNLLFQYRLINSPGFFQNQNTNHNNYLLSSKYQSKSLRYNNYFVLLSNNLQSYENGGFIDTTDVLNDPDFKERYNINTRIGGKKVFSSNFFSNKITTGNKYKETSFLFRQQYDLGKKDSLVTDSTIVPLFFPRLRFEHTLSLDRNAYSFQDNSGDSIYYQRYYDTSLRKLTDTVLFRDKWSILSNDFSVYQFPDAKNLHQFIKLGLLVQHISGQLSSGKSVFFNTAGHAEYRNKTRNQRWDIEANGRLFFTGFNAGDFEAHASLKSMLGKKAGYLELGFENVNRTPSFNFDPRSSFYLMKTSINLKKENNTHLYGSYYLPALKLKLSGHYYLVTNYTYLSDYYTIRQETSLFNLLQVAVEKTIRFGKRWNWHAEVYLQQQVGTAPVNVPALYTRNRIGYEGNLGFKNLDIAFGTEIKYRAAYKADDYSPALGQFVFQDTLTIRNELPDIAAYLHFRIRPFMAFVRLENLNTARNMGGFGFTRNNLVAPYYALPGMQFRLGVFWRFVN